MPWAAAIRTVGLTGSSSMMMDTSGVGRALVGGDLHRRAHRLLLNDDGHERGSAYPSRRRWMVVTGWDTKDCRGTSLYGGEEGRFPTYGVRDWRRYIRDWPEA